MSSYLTNIVCVNIFSEYFFTFELWGHFYELQENNRDKGYKRNFKNYGGKNIFVEIQ